MIIRADRRLAFLAMAKMAGVGALLGLVFGVVVAVSGQTRWSILLGPFVLGLFLALTLGSVVALSWYIFPGRVTYRVTDSSLEAWRGGGMRKQIPLDRIARVELLPEITWRDLVFSGWFGYTSPIPQLLVTLTATQNRWDPSNSATESFPSVLIAGERQSQAMLELRQAINLTPDG